MPIFIICFQPSCINHAIDRTRSSQYFTPWIINFSSSAVYGDIEWEEPVTEQSPTRPITTYGVSKLSAERYLHANHEGISTSLRLFNCSGPYKTKDLISDICKRLIFEDENNLKIGCLNTKRHFLHVSDVVEVIKRLLSIKKEERNKFNREFKKEQNCKMVYAFAKGLAGYVFVDRSKGKYEALSYKKGKRTPSSKYRGVRRNKHNKLKLWQAQIRIDRKKKYLGSYATEEEAARAYDAEGARLGQELNFPEEWKNVEDFEEKYEAKETSLRQAYVKGFRRRLDKSDAQAASDRDGSSTADTAGSRDTTERETDPAPALSQAAE